MADDRAQLPVDPEEAEGWAPPQILDRGTIEAKLFSDEPDPWGP